MVSKKRKEEFIMARVKGKGFILMGGFQYRKTSVGTVVAQRLGIKLI
ncbi:Glk, partial [Pasteurella multocida subsp. multocida str. Anand1_buffalo]